jgi:hypothetical protein
VVENSFNFDDTNSQEMTSIVLMQQYLVLFSRNANLGRITLQYPRYLTTRFVAGTVTIFQRHKAHLITYMRFLPAKGPAAPTAHKDSSTVVTPLLHFALTI